MSRLSPSVLFMIMLVSCLFIFLGPATQMNAQGSVSVMLIILLGIGAFLTLSSLRGEASQREASRKMLGTLTGLSAVICAALLGKQIIETLTGTRSTIFGIFGLMCGAGALAAAYMIFLALISRSGLNVEEGEVLLIQRRMDHQHVIRPPGLHSPMMPALESGVAVMPTYSIETDVEVEMVDTATLHKVDKIGVDTEARILQHFPEAGEIIPVEMRYEGFLKLPYQFPNRDHVFKELADAHNKTISEARMSASFWIEAIQGQIQRDVEEELRTIIHGYTFYNQEKHAYTKLGPADISNQRVELSAMLKQRLQEKVTQWGVEMLDVKITQVVLDPSRIQAFYRGASIEREDQEAERLLNRELNRTKRIAEVEVQRTQQLAEAEAYRTRTLAEAEIAVERSRNKVENEASLAMLNDWMDAMIAKNPDMNPEDLKHLLMVALDEHKKRMLYRERNLIDQD